MAQAQPSTGTTLIQFAPFSSAVDATFWHALSQRKMDVFKLDASAVAVAGFYEPGSGALGLGAGAFETAASAQATAPRGSFSGAGLLLNTNTVEDFKNMDKTATLKAASERVWRAIVSGDALTNQSLLAAFSVLTFADLKKFKFYFWFAFPALLPTDHFTMPVKDGIRPLKDVWGKQRMDSLKAAYDALRGFNTAIGSASGSSKPAPIDTAFVLVKKDPTNPHEVLLGKLVDWDAFWKDIPAEEWTIAYADPSNLPTNPGWPLRNFLILLKHRFKLGSVNIICYREGQAKRDMSISSVSLFLKVNLPGSLADDLPKSVGWEKNSTGKLGARLVDLAPMMDPIRLAETAVDLNLKLMRWRIMPELQLEKISGTKCLLLGSGTLGCYVARALMAWGVRKLTLVDNGTVSFSNPVRQPLFTFEDSMLGKPKAAAAADALKKIFPGIDAQGVNLNIPMPGHPSTSLEATKKDVAALKQLIDDHDVLYLLTDSREARWLPTVIGAAAGKIVINCALGFDTFLVMRHGVRGGAIPESVDREAVHGGAMGCYYCNDVVAPADSLSDRTLDQQCTVTRPGLSLLASGLAVELMVSILNHPDGQWAPAETVANPTESTKHPLGVVPHQIRGFLTHFSNLLVSGRAYDKCTACSSQVLEEYKRDNAVFVDKVLKEPKYLEELTGLTKLHNDTENADVDWDEEEGEEDF
ncbi:UNVERIFIED_CONTAM: Autophagy protein 7 [Siphonaria sp. JEL0065]|nr:Autophagy protein 7 [Siphonaria sp. JEL0065]